MGTINGATVLGVPLPGVVNIAQNITLGLDQAFDIAKGTLGCTNVLLNGRQLTTTGVGTVGINGTVSGTGEASRIVKTGPGTLRIAGLVLNAGGLTVNEGTLDVPGGIFSGNTVTMTGGRITGNGTLPTVTATSGEIIPTGGDLSITNGLTLSPEVKATVALTGPGAENKVIVNGGAVNLANAELVIDSTAYQPVWDEDFTIMTIGSGARTGIFKDLPQGAEVRVNATTVGRISYTGGNGNDIVLDIISTTRTWDGGSVANDNWDEAQNWTQNTRPNFGDALVFPAGIQSTDRGLDNNFPTDTIFRQLVFNGDDYTLRGNRFKLSDGMKIGVGNTQAIFDVNLDTSVVLTRDQTFQFDEEVSQASLNLDLLDEIDTAGHTLSFSGYGTIHGKIAGAGRVMIKGGSTIFFEDLNTYTGLTVIEPGAVLELDTLGLDATLGTTDTGTTVHGRLVIENVGAISWEIDEPLFLASGAVAESSSGQNAALPTRVVVDFRGPIQLLGGPVKFLAERKPFDARNRISGRISGVGDLTITDIFDDGFANDDGVLEDQGWIISGGQNNTFVGSLSVPKGLLELEKDNDGILAVSCQILSAGKIDGDGRDVGGVVTNRSEQIADGCQITLHNGSYLSIGNNDLSFGGNNQPKTETIGSLIYEGRNASVISADGSTLIVNGGISTLVGTASNNRLGNPSHTTTLKLAGDPCLMEIGSSLTVHANVSNQGASTIRRTGDGNLTFTGSVNMTFDLEDGRTDFNGNGSSSLIRLKGGDIGGGGFCGDIVSSAEGGRISPGTVGAANFAILTSRDQVLNSATRVEIGIKTAIVGTGHDQLRAQGTVNLGNARLELSDLSNTAIPVGAKITILSNDGTDAIAGTFSGLPEGDFIPIGASAGWIITYEGGDGNDVVLTRVSGPPVAPTLSTITLSKGTGIGGLDQVRLTGTGTVGSTFTLQTSTDLILWTDLQSVSPAANGTFTVTITRVPGELKRFFRLKY